MKKQLILRCLAALLLLTGGCTPSQAGPPPAPTPSLAPTAPLCPSPTPAPAVTVHWDALSPRPTPRQNVGGRWYDGDAPQLLPRPDYGRLIPYAGARSTGQWPAMSGCLYGLMTARGVAVTDPVYSEVQPLGWPRPFPLLALVQGEQGGEDEPWKRMALAADDGSWVTGFDYRDYRIGADGLVLFSDTGVERRDREGRLLQAVSFPELGLDDAGRARFLDAVRWGGSWEGAWEGDLLCLGPGPGGYDATLLLYRFSTGEIFAEETGRAQDLLSMSFPLTDQWQLESSTPGETVFIRGEERRSIPYGTAEGWAYVEGELVLFPESGAVYTLEGVRVLPPGGGEVEYLSDTLLGPDGPGVLKVWSQSGREAAFYRTDGAHLLTAPQLRWEDVAYQSSLAGGLLEVLEPGYASYYDLDGRCVFRRCLFYEPD